MNKAQKKTLREILGNIDPVIWMLLLIITIFSCVGENFFSFGNLLNIIKQASPFLILAIAETMAVLVGQIDLSVGNNMAFCTVIVAMLMSAGVPWPVAALAGVVTGGLCGLLNGVLVAKLHLPVFIVTLGTQNIFRSLSLLISNSATIYYKHPIFRTIGKGTFLGFTYTVWIAMV